MPTQTSPNQTAPPTLWLTKTEAAAYAKVGARLIQDAVNAGHLQAFAIGKGKEYRLRAQDIDTWLTARAWEPGK